jgi:hypothetical protein
MLLIYTTSYDTTVDLLLHHLGGERCFRYNFDLWREYCLEITENGFRIEDPTGRTATDGSVSKLLYRKPFVTRDLGGELPTNPQDDYCEQELWYAMREVVNLMWSKNRIVLIEPRADARVGKFVQLQIARRYFRVPQYQFRRGMSGAFFGGRQVIVKSLTSEPVGGCGDLNVVYTTRVEEANLAPGFPWMVQECVSAEKDITVVFVRDRLFAFELNRTSFLERTVDWRELPIDSTACQWKLHALPGTVSDNILSFMKDLNLHFGRIDLLLAGDTYFFLEVNPNGQWGWLDTEAKHGLLDKVLQEISPVTQCHPIPAQLRVAV